MAVAKDKPIKEGHLIVQNVLKKKWQKKFCVLYSYSNHGLDERLEIFDSEDEASRRSRAKRVLLDKDNCEKISLDPQRNHPYAFSIVTKQGTSYFSCLTPEECQDWVSACQGVAFQDSFSTVTIEEDNELYCSGDDGVFRVALVSTEASQRCGLPPGDYTLVVAPEELQLRQSETQSQLFNWPYRFIRRYGHKRGRFNFEAGRKCASGEGSFDLEHANPQEIFKCMTAKMESMKQRLGGSGSHSEKHSTTSTLRPAVFLPGSPDIGIPTCFTNAMDVDEGLDAARDMTARSRSPLVSLSSSTTPIGVSTVAGALPPMKPPRKNPPVPALTPRYDPVEVRTEAWRTHGTDTVDRQADRLTATPFPAAAVFVRSPPHDLSHSDYDKLDHFGSTPKLDEDPSYSTIRQDSTGYGVIRKVRSPQHEVYKDKFEYAMVFKHHQPSHKV